MSSTRIHVEGLHELITEKELQQRFDTFGKISDVQVIRNTQGRCKGFGYVTFHGDEAVIKKCTGVLNNAKWRGHVLRISKAKTDYKTKLEKEWEVQRIAALPPPPPDPTVKVKKVFAWKRGKGGRMLPVMHITKPSGKTMLVDPSKLKDNITIFEGTLDDSRMKPISALAWSYSDPSSRRPAAPVVRVMPRLEDEIAERLRREKAKSLALLSAMGLSEEGGAPKEKDTAAPTLNVKKKINADTLVEGETGIEREAVEGREDAGESEEAKENEDFEGAYSDEDNDVQDEQGESEHDLADELAAVLGDDLAEEKQVAPKLPKKNERQEKQASQPPKKEVKLAKVPEVKQVMRGPLKTKPPIKVSPQVTEMIEEEDEDEVERVEELAIALKFPGRREKAVVSVEIEDEGEEQEQEQDRDHEGQVEDEQEDENAGDGEERAQPEQAIDRDMQDAAMQNTQGNGEGEVRDQNADMRDREQEHNGSVEADSTGVAAEDEVHEGNQQPSEAEEVEERKSEKEVATQAKKKKKKFTKGSKGGHPEAFTKVSTTNAKSYDVKVPSLRALLHPDVNFSLLSMMPAAPEIPLQPVPAVQQQLTEPKKARAKRKQPPAAVEPTPPLEPAPEVERVFFFNNLAAEDTGAGADFWINVASDLPRKQWEGERSHFTLDYKKKHKSATKRIARFVQRVTK